MFRNCVFYKIFTLHTFFSISCSISWTSFISNRSLTDILFDVSGLDDEPSFFNFLVSVIIVKLIIKLILVVCLLSSTEIFFYGIIPNWLTLKCYSSSSFCLSAIYFVVLEVERGERNINLKNKLARILQSRLHVKYGIEIRFAKFRRELFDINLEDSQEQYIVL